jgi:hypothetical protein
MGQPTPKPYKRWPVEAPGYPPTLSIDVEVIYKPLISIERFEGGLVWMTPDEARLVIARLQDALKYLEEA